jgi:hypothetical protein
MPTNIILDQEDGRFLHLEAAVLKAISSDFMLDSPERRKSGGPNFRRALVHDQNDGLTVNFAGDYPGGITLTGVAEITPHPGPGPQLPNPILVVRGGISYEVDVPTGAVGQGAIEGETHTITVNVDEALSAHQKEIVELRARIAVLEART